jgi:uncharacterized membrane protein
MASRKPARAASGQTRIPGSGRPGSRNSRRGNGTETSSSSTAVRGGRQARPDAADGGRARNAQNGRDGGRAGSTTATQARAGATAAAAAPRPQAPRFSAPFWLQIAALVLSLAGVGVSVYLTIAHYTSSSILACSDKGVVNCAKVTTSPESVVFGIFPVAVLGLAFYVVMAAINSPWAWRSQLPLLWWGRTAAAIAGIGFVIYLLYAEIIQIGNICLWCTSVHVITFLLFVLLMSVAPFGSTAKAKAAR